MSSMKWNRISLAVIVLSGMGHAAWAQPRFDICEDVGPTLGMGVSVYGAVGDVWPNAAVADHGASWQHAFWYALVNDDREWIVNHKGTVARPDGAMMVFTFYHILQLGQNAGYNGTEAEVVKQAVEDPVVMHEFFTRFIQYLELFELLEAPVLMHVEPDAWGFMMWSFGTDGNDDATSIEVRVGGSGHPDATGFADHAGGLGQALLAMRDRYAPSVRMGWHAANFRVGTRPEVTAGFYSSMGPWDVLVVAHPHNEANGAAWWEPWDETRLATNLAWFRTVSTSAGLPILMWQIPMGWDYHVIPLSGDRSALARFAEANIVGMMTTHLGVGDPDEWRGFGSFAEVPPEPLGIGGTAADYRSRVATYALDPLVLPEGSLCAGGRSGAVDAGPTPDAPVVGQPTDDTGCGCRTGGGQPVGLALGVLWLVAWYRRADRRNGRRRQAPG